MRQNIMKKFYQPVLFFFLLPLFQIFPGLIFSLRYEPVNPLSFVVLYLFILFNQMLENVLLRIPDSRFDFSKRFFFTVELLNILTILYFGFRHSWLAALVLVLFSALIQTQFLFSYYHLEFYATILAVVLKAVFLNAFSFYIGTGFISPWTIPYFAGLILPFFLYEVSRVRPEMTKQVRLILVVLSYIVGVVLLWPHLSFASLLLLLSAPFAWDLLNEELNRRNTSVFAINFALFYVLLLMIAQFH